MKLNNIYDENEVQGAFGRVLCGVSFGDWTIGLDWITDRDNYRHYFLCVHADGKCNISGEPMKWKGRKWPLSRHMTEGEIVQTAFLAVMTAMEHEIREQFKWFGQSVFDPHYDINKLHQLRAQPDALKERDHG